MDSFQPIYPPGFGPGGFIPGSVADSAPTNNQSQPPEGGSPSTDVSNTPSSASILSLGSASVTASLGSSSTIVASQPSSPVSTLFNSASTPISTLFNSAAGSSGSGPSVVTSLIAVSTTTVAGLSNTSGSAAKAAEGITSPIPEPILRDQTIIGVAVAIVVWLLIIIAALSWCLWRKRKIIRNRGEKLGDDTATSMRPDMSQRDVEAIMGMAPARPATQPRSTAPRLPQPAFLMTRSTSTMDLIPGPLGSHPVSRNARHSGNETPRLSMLDYESLASRLSAPPRSPSTIFPGIYRLSEHSAITSISSRTSKTKETLVTTRALSTASDSDESTTPEPIAALRPTLGKLNTWLESNRRRSRVAASSRGISMDFPNNNNNNRDTYTTTNTTREEIEKGEEEEDAIKEPSRIRADSDTLGPPTMSAIARPMSLASLKDIYRRSATLERSINGMREGPAPPAK